MSIGLSSGRPTSLHMDWPRFQKHHKNFSTSSYDPNRREPTPRHKAAAPAPEPHRASRFILPDVNTVSSSWKVFPP